MSTTRARKQSVQKHAVAVGQQQHAPHGEHDRRAGERGRRATQPHIGRHQRRGQDHHRVWAGAGAGRVSGAPGPANAARPKPKAATSARCRPDRARLCASEARAMRSMVSWCRKTAVAEQQGHEHAAALVVLPCVGRSSGRVLPVTLRQTKDGQDVIPERLPGGAQP